MRDRFSAAAFYVLSVLLFPVTLTGYVIWVGKGLLFGRGTGVSATAQGPLFARFFQHRLGIREDEPACRLMMVLPNVPAVGLHLFVAPLLFAHRVTGYVRRPSDIRSKATFLPDTRLRPASRSSMRR